MMMIVDFTKEFGNQDLYSGRKNGERAREQLFSKPNIVNDGKWKFISRAGQFISSSYFLGLLGDSIFSFSTVNEAFKYINLDELDQASKEECIRAIKRGTTPNGDLF